MIGKLREEDEGQWKSNQNGERPLCVAESGQKPRPYGCIQSFLSENSAVLGKQWCFNWFSGCVHVDSYFWTKNYKSGCGQSGIIASIVAYCRLVWLYIAATLGREHLYVLFEGLDHSCLQPFDYFYVSICIIIMHKSNWWYWVRYLPGTWYRIAGYLRCWKISWISEHINHKILISGSVDRRVHLGYPH